MNYRSFGQTGKDVSVISFGGMRFPEPQDMEQSADLVLYAHSRGINYFDTAPVYCADRSEDIFGHALSQQPRDSYLLSTKCGRAKGQDLRQSLERSLRRLQTDHIDFFYIWHLMSRDDWEQRKQGGAVEAALKAKEEGLIGHLLCSSHMPGEGLAEVLAEGFFEGVLLGYNAINFPYRQQAVTQAEELNLGVVTMNPLAGGLIPQNPQRFAFLKQDSHESIVQAALRFNLSHSAITSALVGFSEKSQVDEAIAAVDSVSPQSEESRQQLSVNIEKTFDQLCTGCGYCLPCPVDIPIPQFMDVYNQVLLSHNESGVASNRFRMHWGLTADQAAVCTGCGLCEQRCTQHLPIMKRLAELAG